VAALEESLSWYSPTYGASGKGQKGPGQKSEPCRTDYQRWKMDDVVDLERKLTKLVFSDRTRKMDAESVLFNSGMAALSGIFGYIDSEIAHADLHKLEPPVFKTRDLYFEVDQVIADHFTSRGIKPREFDPQDVDALSQAMGEEVPAAVFLNPQSNMYEMQTTDISRLLENLTHRDWFDKLPKKFKNEGYWTHHINLVIDNSTLGRLAKWKEFDFTRLPACIRVITFESLIKFAQDGQDMAQGGLATAVGSYIGSDLRRMRSERGLMPPETTVRRLQSFGSADTLDRKLERHSRNTLFLANEIQSGLQENGFLREVVHPLLSDHPDHAIAKRENAGAGGLFHIGLNTDFLRTYGELHRYRDERVWLQDRAVEPSKHKEYAESIARAYLKLVTALAKRAGLELNLGTSYGFHTTRLAVYTKLRTKQEEPDHYFQLVPYLRVATGTENIKDCTLIADVIRRADDIFTKAIDHRQILMLSRWLMRSGEKALDWNFGL
jgi:cystathionine beta-lyase/cystathionine gamma-synthase